jgi:polysaccharide export outer membrane protein
MRKLLLLFSLFCLFALTGCNWLYPSMMLRAPRNYPYAKLNDSISSIDYKISVNDLVTVRLYSQDGFRLIDYTSLIENGVGSLGVTSSTDYLVEPDGTVRIPVLGRLHITGYTIREATQILEQKFSQYYIKPFILLSVTNRRVIVFPGDPGAARVVPLTNNNTTLIEVLANMGGITNNGKAKQIKLIRGNPNKPDIYLIDLSKIEDIKLAYTIMQEGDIIYVTPQRQLATDVVNKITPTISAISVVTSLFLTILILKSSKL